MNQNVVAATWETEIEISTDIGTEYQGSPSIAVNGSRVHVVWADDGDGAGDSDIYYRYFNGTIWQPEQEISTDIGIERQVFPSIAVSGSKVHVVWEDWEDGDGDIYYRHFDGTTWQPEEEISTDTAWGETQSEPSIAVSDNKVHVVWEESAPPGDSDIYYRYFNGFNWEPEQEISTDTGTEYQWSPSIAVSDSKVHVVWEDWEDGDGDIFDRYFNGTHWQPEQEISMDAATERQWGPAIAMDDGEVHVVWVDDGNGDYDIHYRYFNGFTWQPEREISTDSGTEEQSSPSIAVEDGKVHVVWFDYGDGDADIYYRYFNGSTWWPEQEVSTDAGTEHQTYPSIAVEDARVHVAWHDYDDGDADIYYRRGTEGIGDTTPPESNANPISPYWQTTPVFDIDWTASDDYDLANISLYFRFSIDNLSWTPWGDWMCNNTLFGTSATGSFSFAAPYEEGFYQFYTIAVDSAGNIETKPATAEAMAGLAPAIPLPPGNLNAFLGGDKFHDVTLLWSLSPDDGAGKNNVERYDILRGSAYDSGGSSYLLHASVPAGTSSYVDVQAGEGNSGNYFYFVSAVGFSNLSSSSPNQAGKFTRTLAQGPNLVSIPLIQSDEDIEIVLQTVEYDKAWSYDSSTQEWKWFMKNKEYRRGLWNINHTMGIWVSVTLDSNLTIAGVVPAQTRIHLYEGWNLVSFPSFNASYTGHDLRMDTAAIRVEGHDPSPPCHLRVLGDAEVLWAGYGYWVMVGADTTWTVNIQ